MFAAPVAATLAAMLVSSPAAAQTVAIDSGRGQPPRRDRDHPLLFQAGPRRASRPGRDRRRPEGADRDRPVPGRENQPGRRPSGRDRGRKPGDRPRRLRGQQEGQGRAAYGGSPVQAARHAVAPDGAVRRRSASPKSIATPAATTFASIRKSSSSRTTASISSSRSPRAPKPASSRSSSSATVAYSSYRLKDVIKTRESNLLSFLGGDDVYDPDRVEADRDLIRRYYLKHGFADVQVVAALTEYDPDKKGFLVTFKIEEGQQYRVASVNFAVQHRHARRQFAAQLLAGLCRVALQRRSAGEVGRGNADRGLAPRLCLRDRAVRAATAISSRTPSRSPSPSTRARGPTSSASMSAATPAPATT